MNMKLKLFKAKYSWQYAGGMILVAAMDFIRANELIRAYPGEWDDAEEIIGASYRGEEGVLDAGWYAE